MNSEVLQTIIYEISLKCAVKPEIIKKACHRSFKNREYTIKNLF
jgi:hypothetical protein